MDNSLIDRRISARAQTPAFQGFVRRMQRERRFFGENDFERDLGDEGETIESAPMQCLRIGRVDT